MPEFNRRRFLQVSAAAGLAPALPALSVNAAAVTSSLTPAQQLWVSLYKNAAQTQNVAGLTNAMGITNQAAHRVFERLIQTQAVAAQGLSSLSRAQPPAPTNPTAQPVAEAMEPKRLKVDVKKFLTETDEAVEDALDEVEEVAELGDAQTLDTHENG